MWCVYGCMEVWMYGCMHVCMYACMHVCMYLYVRVFSYVFIYSMFIYIYLHISNFCLPGRCHCSSQISDWRSLGEVCWCSSDVRITQGCSMSQHHFPEAWIRLLGGEAVVSYPLRLKTLQEFQRHLWLRSFWAFGDG